MPAESTTRRRLRPERPGPLATANEWLRLYERFWTDRLDVLDRLLREDDARQATIAPPTPPLPTPATPKPPKTRKGDKP